MLAQAVLTEALRSMAAGANAMMLRRGIDKAAQEVQYALRRQATPIQHRDEIANIAAIASGDDEIGELIAQAMDTVGRDGAITVDESRGLETEIDHTEGMTFDKGYASPEFITDRDNMQTIIEDPYILVTNSKPTHIHDLVPLLDQLNQAGKKEFVVISDELAGDPLAVLLVNNQRGNLNSLGVKAPGYGDRRKHMLEDIAILVGGTCFGPEAGRKARRRHARRPGAGAARDLPQGRDDHRGRQGSPGRHPVALAAAQGGDGRSEVRVRPGPSRGTSPHGSRAVWPSSTSAPPPKSSSRKRRPASRTPWQPRERRSSGAWSPAGGVALAQLRRRAGRRRRSDLGR